MSKVIVHRVGWVFPKQGGASFLHVTRTQDLRTFVGGTEYKSLKDVRKAYGSISWDFRKTNEVLEIA